MTTALLIVVIVLVLLLAVLLLRTRARPTPRRRRGHRPTTAVAPCTPRRTPAGDRSRAPLPATRPAPAGSAGGGRPPAGRTGRRSPARRWRDRCRRGVRPGAAAAGPASARHAAHGPAVRPLGRSVRADGEDAARRCRPGAGRSTATARDGRRSAGRWRGPRRIAEATCPVPAGGRAERGRRPRRGRHDGRDHPPAGRGRGRRGPPRRRSEAEAIRAAVAAEAEKSRRQAELEVSTTLLDARRQAERDAAEITETARALKQDLDRRESRLAEREERVDATVRRVEQRDRRARRDRAGARRAGGPARRPGGASTSASWSASPA